MVYPLMDKSPRPEVGPICPDSLSSPIPNSFCDKKQEFSILEKLKELRDQKTYCDIILEVRGTHLEAHKNVLASWSPYFASKLYPNDNTVCKDFVSVNYNNSEVFADLLDFMYNGYVAPRETNFLELLHLAVSFQIQTLKNYCEEFLRCNLHLGNFVSTYFLSRKFTLESLEEYIVGFLQLNLSDAVKQGEFLSLTASKFNTFLSNGSMEKIKPEIKLFLIISWVGYDVQDREKFLVLLLGHIDWSTVANDFLLEINRTENFFTSHESSLYLLLQTLFSTGIELGPYNSVFPLLRERHSGLLNEVVSSSLIQIEQEDFYPVTIVVKSRPTFKEAAINTNFTNTVDCAINTDVNSRHFEEHEARETDNIEEHENSVTDDISPEETISGKSAIQPNQDIFESYNDFGKFIESEIYELNRKKYEEGQSFELDRIIEPEPELKNQTAVANGAKVKPKRKRKKTQEFSSKLDESSEEEAIESKVHEEDFVREQKFLLDVEAEDRKHDKSTCVPNEITENYLRRSIRNSVRSDSLKKLSEKRTKSVPKKLKKTDKTIHCTYEDCPYYTTLSERMDKHVKTAHLCSFELRCNLCPFVSKEVRKYNYHMKTHFAGPPFKCDHPRCTFSHNRIAKMIRHRAAHNDERPFTCECGKSFRTNNTLAAHKQTHEGKKDFKCPICGVAFAKKNTVNQHMVTHSNAKPYLCDLCGFATKFQSHLIAHKRIHSGDMFECSFPKCTYMTPKRSQLKAHMRAHLGVRAHVCQTCGKSFIEKSHLVRHEKIHSNERLGCMECDYTTTRKDKLREHVAKYHTPESPNTTKQSKKQKNTNTSKTKKTQSLVQKKSNISTIEITTPMLVKWDHGGYSLSQDSQGSTSQTETETVIGGDTYCVLRDQLTTNEPMQQILSLNQDQGQLSESKIDIRDVQPISQVVTNLPVSTNPGSGIVTSPHNSIISDSDGLEGNQAAIDHVTNGAIVTTVMDGDTSSQTYTIIQPATGVAVPSQDCGGLSAFMALF